MPRLNNRLVFLLLHLFTVVNGEDRICQNHECEYTNLTEKISIFATGILEGGCIVEYNETTGKTCCYAEILSEKRCESGKNSDTCLPIIVKETENEHSGEGCLLTVDNPGSKTDLKIQVKFKESPDQDKRIRVAFAEPEGRGLLTRIILPVLLFACAGCGLWLILCIFCRQVCLDIKNRITNR